MLEITILDQTKHSLNKPAIILRDMWKALELVDKYADWWPRQLDMYEQGVDFVEVNINVNINNVPLKDHAVTLEVAKHIALMSRTAKGKEYRQKLIELEESASHRDQLTTIRTAVIHDIDIIDRVSQIVADEHKQLSNELADLKNRIAEITKRQAELQPLIEYTAAHRKQLAQELKATELLMKVRDNLKPTFAITHI